MPNEQLGKYDVIDNSCVSHAGNTVWGDIGGGQTKYLSPEELAKHEVSVKDGMLVDSTGKLFDSMHPLGSGNGKAIFVMDPQGKIYASNSPMIGEFHHSSFLSGKPVTAAGEIEVINGRLVGINNRSGHYRPTGEQLRRAAGSGLAFSLFCHPSQSYLLG